MSEEQEAGMRLNKYVAHCGLGSRRKAADWVKAGKVKVNGAVEINPAILVKEGDIVEYGGKVITPEKNLVYILMNKPKNTITTMDDEKGRTTVMDILKGKIEERIFPVGRLDRDTVGLLMLTNDGDLAKRLTHPSHEVSKVYEAVLDKELSEADFNKIKAGQDLEDGRADVDWINYPDPKNKKIARLEIHIGRNRIVRRIFKEVGYTVVKLDRIYFAGLTKKHLARGRWRHLTKEEVGKLKHFS